MRSTAVKKLRSGMRLLDQQVLEILLAVVNAAATQREKTVDGGVSPVADSLFSAIISPHREGGNRRNRRKLEAAPDWVSSRRRRELKRAGQALHRATRSV